ncbi:MAG: HAD-IA family hydrolase [Acidobacteria bacterium]|nr:HAD-IA family hydrolase [Acidobacteriota bacterium]
MTTTYFFDIDGTLLDSAFDIAGAVSKVYPVPEQVVRRYIGRALAEMFADFCPSATPAEIERLSQLYRERYRERGHRSTRVYPGIAETLAALADRKSTATTKSTATAATVLEQFGLRQYFDHVQGTDHGRYKPDPAILLEAAAALGVRPAECLMVGDAPADIEAGRRAGMRTCAVAWGYGDHAELKALEPDLWIDEPRQLLSRSRQLGRQ